MHRFRACLLSALLPLAAQAQMADSEIAELQEQGRAEGWTFTVGRTSATDQPAEGLGGLVIPSDWMRGIALPASGGPAPDGTQPLPGAFSWLTQTGCPPVRNQGGCAACWAFSTVGALECAIRIHDGVDVDLSEQWLLSCNRDDWTCTGGWFAHDYHQWKRGACGHSGAVTEAALPYRGSGVPCSCTANHEYTIDSWAYLDPTVAIPSPDAIKRAIFEQGPVSVAVYASPAFKAYTGGVFNADSANPCDHSVVLVGWDDAQGPAGVWIMRNSWGAGWGEGGYMRIAYGVCSVGYAACAVEYSGRDDLRVSPSGGVSIRGPAGGPWSPQCAAWTLTNAGPSDLPWTAQWAANWFDVVPPAGTLAPGATADVRICPKPETMAWPAGVYEDSVSFENPATGASRIRSVSLHIAQSERLTEFFERKDNDLAYTQVTFTPDGSINGYRACSEPITALPTDPAGGALLPLGDDSSFRVDLSGHSLQLFGRSSSAVFVGSNGYLTIEQGDSSPQASTEHHFQQPRISLLLRDLDPSHAGSISWKLLEDRLAVTWDEVPPFGTPGGNTMQVEWFLDSRIRLAWLDLAAMDGLAGLSRGGGVPAGFSESDLSAYGSCSPAFARADFDHDSDVDARDFGHLQACLATASTAVVPPCLDARLNEDQSIDQLDLAVFLVCAGGPAVPVPPACGW